MIDFGIKYDGYCTDTTRMIYMGKPKKEDIENYQFMLNLQDDLVKNAKKGARCSDLFGYCQKNLGKYKMIHSLGHGVGLEIHESPNLGSKDKTLLNKNVVVTIEPGIYIIGKYGIRIEDTILITSESNEILSRIDKKLKIIK